MMFICRSFFWLLSLLLSSIMWFIVAPWRDYLIFGVACSVIFQEAFRYLFYRLLRYLRIILLIFKNYFNFIDLCFYRAAESGLQKVSEVGVQPGVVKIVSSRVQLAYGNKTYLQNLLNFVDYLFSGGSWIWCYEWSLFFSKRLS